MSEVITYGNNVQQSFCQIKLTNGERILISIVTRPTPLIRISKLLIGLLPVKTIWEFSARMAGGNDEYLRQVVTMFADFESGNEPKPPLDSIRDHLLQCNSTAEVRRLLIKRQLGLKS